MTIFFLATLEHDGCWFDAVGRTEAEATYAIKLAVTTHTKQCGGKITRNTRQRCLDTWRKVQDDVEVREMAAGQPCRDGEGFYVR